MSQVDEDTKVFLRRIWIPRLLAQTNMPAILLNFLKTMSDPNAREQMAHWMSDMYKSNPEMDIGAEDIPTSSIFSERRTAPPLRLIIGLKFSSQTVSRKTNPLMVSTFKRPIYSPATLSVKKNVFCFLSISLPAPIRHDATGKDVAFYGKLFQRHASDKDLLFILRGRVAHIPLSDDLATRQIELDQMTHTQPHWILVDVVTELARRHAESAFTIDAEDVSILTPLLRDPAVQQAALELIPSDLSGLPQLDFRTLLWTAQRARDTQRQFHGLFYGAISANISHGLRQRRGAMPV